MKNSSAFGEAGETISAKDLNSQNLCRQFPICESSKCPPSEAYPPMTTFDDSLIAAALQSNYVPLRDRGVYSVSNIKGAQSMEYNAYFGWNSSSSSASGYHRFSNFMDKCSKGQSHLTVDEHGKVSLQSLSSLHSLADSDWTSVHPPKKLNHRGFRF